MSEQSYQKETFLPSELLIEIGDLTFWWNQLDYLMQNTIWCFLNIPSNQGMALTTHMNVLGKIELLNTLGDILFIEGSEAHTNYRTIINSIDSTRVKRNDIIHALWLKKSDGKHEIIKFTARGKLNTKNFKYDPIEIGKVTLAIQKNFGELTKFMKTTFPDHEHVRGWKRTALADALLKQKSE